MLHTCGIAHEHCRSDRDSYIKINKGNIKPGREHNFDMSSGELYGSYDFESIMHYSAVSFANPGTTTIDPLPKYQPQPNMRQRTAMSSTDKDGVKELYK